MTVTLKEKRLYINEHLLFCFYMSFYLMTDVSVKNIVQNWKANQK